VGAGGHAAAILEQIPNVSHYFGSDRDPAILNEALARLGQFDGRVTLQAGRLSALASRWRTEGAEPAGGVLVDLGVSSRQLDDPSRGFGFDSDAPLDMRMASSDPDAYGTPTAWDLICRLSEKELADLLFHSGGERRSRPIAKALKRMVESRKHEAPTAREVAAVVASVYAAGAAAGKGRFRIHPATLTFQALRIAVNEEREELDQFLSVAREMLAPGGRLAVIAFHSGEDGPVKRAFQKWRKAYEGDRVITRKPIRPGEEEIRTNPRSRSARLRIYERGEG
jgi:16S rRNA (cytosine1402-N4)-methyltransferase